MSLINPYCSLGADNIGRIRFDSGFREDQGACRLV